MHLTLTFTGTKESVLKELQAELLPQEPSDNSREVRRAVTQALADHISRFAADTSVPVNVSVTIHANYAAHLDNDGQEKPAAPTTAK